jgi:hypothetical protein
MVAAQPSRGSAVSPIVLKIVARALLYHSPESRSRSYLQLRHGMVGLSFMASVIKGVS